MDLSGIAIVDHHAHPLLRPSATAGADSFRQWFTESRDPIIHRRHVPNVLFFRTAIRWLAEELDCAPTLEDVLQARAAVSYEDWTGTLFKSANIELLLCDYGYGGERALSHEEMKALLPCEVRPILRLETLAEALIADHDTFDDMVEDFIWHLRQARHDGYVALKTIIAYRSGLDILRPQTGPARSAFGRSKAEADRSGRVRLTAKALCDFLVWLAVEEAERQDLPLQFHTGFGDQDANLLTANPLHLRSIIEQSRAPLVLLHAGWPYFREAAHLAALYPNVWLDLSLAVPLTTLDIPAMIRSVLGVAPFSKVMFATDAFTMPEIYWLAARWGRWGLAKVLEEMVDDSFLDAGEAHEVAGLLLNDNARRLYALDIT